MFKNIECPGAVPDEFESQVNKIYDEVEAQLRQLPETYEEENYILKLGQERINKLYNQKNTNQ